jgi:tetratricopeptide (TPR) repeat protein
MCLTVQPPLIVVGIITAPVWGPFYLGYVGLVQIKSVHEYTVKPKVKEATKATYYFFHPDALKIKIADMSVRITVRSSAPALRIRRGELYLLAGDLDSAMKDFETALEVTDDIDPLAHFYKGAIHFARGQADEAVQHYNLAIEHEDKRSSFTSRQKMYDSTMNMMESAHHSFQKKRDQTKIALSNLFGMKDMLDINSKYEKDEAIKDQLDALFEQGVSLADMHLNKGLAQMYVYDYEAAIQSFETAIQLSPEKKVSRYNFILGSALYYAQRYQEAAEKFTLVVNQEDAYKDKALVMRACCYDFLSMCTEAENDRNLVSPDSAIEKRPIHVRFLSNDAMVNIAEFLPSEDLKSLSLSCRHIKNVLYNELEFNPLASKLANTNYFEFRFLESPLYKKLSSNQLINFLKYAVQIDQVEKFIKIWQNDDPTREASAKRLLDFYSNASLTKLHNLPENIQELLAEDGKELDSLVRCFTDSEQPAGIIWNHPSLNYNDSLFQQLGDYNGASLVVVAYTDDSTDYKYVYGYRSTPWMDGNEHDKNAWIYSEENGKCRVLHDGLCFEGTGLDAANHNMTFGNIELPALQVSYGNYLNCYRSVLSGDKISFNGWTTTMSMRYIAKVQVFRVRNK